jgi:hypothetical protein
MTQDLPPSYLLAQEAAALARARNAARKRPRPVEILAIGNRIVIRPIAGDRGSINTPPTSKEAADDDPAR